MRRVTFFVAPLHTLLLFLLILLLLGEGDGIFDEAQVSHGEAVGPLRSRGRCLRPFRVGGPECERVEVRL